MKKKLLMLMLVSVPTLFFAQRTKVAFLSNAVTINAITEPDTKAAGLYVESFYGTDFKYLNAATMVSSDLNDVAVVFFYYDNTGSYDLPGGNLSPTVISNLTTFVQSGGSMLLAGFGTRIIDDLGRIPYEPGIAGNGAGGSNPDYWGINNVEGMPNGNMSTHAVYAGVTTTNQSNNAGGTYGYNFVPLINNGYKEDHNSMWDLGAIPGLTQPHASVARGAEFQTLTNSVILGSWQHVTDMCCVSAIEFLPTGTYTGRIIAYGPAAYEWEMNDSRTNTFNNNVKLITTNALTYLKNYSVTLDTESFENLNQVSLSPNPTADFVMVNSTNGIQKISIYNANGQNVKAVLDENRLDVRNLSSGIYIVTLTDNNNVVYQLKFIKQ
ncbi:DUF4960 domain-containing protein [Flavobacterium sp. UMI-01]|uniref:DUF4960 domain-containing protein n=1 Tax=Flavobacterium sp. UMI-01 TaxID=1441053 RepID=UPI001C7DBB02|nr:DUF4960 domain-containing protein [Flavobacterium sp. UMI-01]GIZ09251.1 hypothetical protein FUMI01_19780 [Flavobacterium sp. UMI-01]